ncbi:unnamed protein product [Brassicogethes aeneus]|uniref:RRP15-like protein n=1 Tax=Brassicogethes aeneus TaxID=1431903 RepID=A0A9P0AYW4_BRAAE|nr:unnamed protein product [Brassicogethes aeneus]
MTVMATKSKVVEETSDNEENLSSEADDENSNSEGGESDYEEGVINAGWADSISKILKTNKPKGKKTLVLSKAKKINDVKKKAKPAGFEVETSKGDIKEEQIEPDSDDEDDKQPLRKKKKELPNIRVKPNILEKDRERILSKIATKGVVQLFNAVRMQQKDISEKLKEAGPLEVRKEKVMKNIDKRAFLDVLMGEKSTNIEKETVGQKKLKKEDSTWSVLKDDFMMSAKMKDWDKELEEEENEEERELESE